VSLKREADGVWVGVDGARTFFPWELLSDSGHEPELVDCDVLPGAKAVSLFRLTPLYGLTPAQAQQAVHDLNILRANWASGLA